MEMYLACKYVTTIFRDFANVGKWSHTNKGENINWDQGLP